MIRLSRRATVAIIVGLVAAGLSLVQAALPKPGISDFADLYHGAVLLLHGINPYPVIRSLHPEVPLYYPVPALLIVSPLTVVTRVHAQAIFCGIGMGALAYAGYGSPLLVSCLSASAMLTVVLGQWSTLLVASAMIPALGFLWACKPSIGLTIATGYGSTVGALLALTVFGVSTLLAPDLFRSWLEGFGTVAHRPLILRPGGFLLLLALLRWRRPEARMLVALACIPQVGGLYDALPLFLIPRTRWQAYALVALSDVAALIPAPKDAPLVVVIAHGWPWMLGLLYLPALIMLLLSPNSSHSGAATPSRAPGDTPAET